MRSSTIIMVAVAAVFGLLAVFVAQSWLNRQAEARLKSIDAQKKVAVAPHSLVVASRPLRFGAELTAAALQELPWASESLPPGSFTSIQDLISGGKRIVLTAIEPNEPILSSKITGSGQRATLSALIADGKKASTVRVNDVDGVAGFVLPGDRVDVILSRQIERGSAVNNVVLQNAKVLAIDQLADERADKPSVAKAVTLEVDIAGAQKLSLASQIGTLSLALRKAGDSEAAASRPITLADLFNSKADEQDSSGSKIDESDHRSPNNDKPDHRGLAKIWVTRGEASHKTDYDVPRTGRDGDGLAEGGLRPASD